MLSIQTITTSSGMSSYYSADGYYAKDDEQAKQASQWHGKGAAAAGLSGYVNPQDFQRVLDGNTPDGNKLGVVINGELKHRAGVDLTFSAPKSVSIMALVSGDERLIAAHDAAVKTTLDSIEKKLLETRVWDGASNTQIKERGIDMVAALFRHEVNRNQDPQLHTHSVIANMARSADGKWRSIEPASLYQNKMAAGAMYRNELAMNVRDLGYGIERTHKDGRFDLKGVPESVMEAFSTRSQEIREALEGYDVKNAKTAANAALMTRDHKVTVDRAQLLDGWKQRAVELGFKPDTPTQHVMSDSNKENRHALEAVDYSIRHLSERASVFSLSELKITATGFGVGQFRTATLDRVIASDERLILSKHPDHKGKGFVTTKEAIATEKETVSSMKAAQDAGREFLKFSAINKGLEGTFLNQGQQAAVRALLSGRDRIIGIQGYAGVGKTTLLTVARELAEKRNCELIGLAPSASAAKTLHREAGIPSQTLQRFLGRYDGYAHGRGTKDGKTAVRKEFRRKMIVVDESSLASTTQIRDLFRIVETVRPARVVLVGDDKQLNAVDAGKPFAQLQDHGMKTLKVDEIVRQKTPELKSAVHAAIAGDISAAFSKIGDNIIEAEEKPPIPDYPENRLKDTALAEAAFDAWNAMPEDKRDGTGIAAPTHIIRQEINELVREQLDTEGRLVGPEKEIDTLKSEGFSNAERGQARNYFAGDNVMFTRERGDIQQGEVLSITGADAESNTVALARKDGETVVLDLNSERAAQSVDVLKSSSLGIRQGDRIRFTKNDESLGLVNSEIAEVTGIDKEGNVTLQKEDGGTLTLEANAPALQFIDHAWASTAHAFQGRTVDDIIGVMHASHPHLTDQKAFYVEISRARDNATLITDDKTLLHQTLAEKTGERIAALEAVPMHQEETIMSPLETTSTPTLEVEKEI